jgi:hypothetical protein
VVRGYLLLIYRLFDSNLHATEGFCLIECELEGARFNVRIVLHVNAGWSGEVVVRVIMTATAFSSVSGMRYLGLNLKKLALPETRHNSGPSEILLQPRTHLEHTSFTSYASR